MRHFYMEVQLQVRAERKYALLAILSQVPNLFIFFESPFFTSINNEMV